MCQEHYVSNMWCQICHPNKRVSHGARGLDLNFTIIFEGSGILRAPLSRPQTREGAASRANDAARARRPPAGHPDLGPVV